MIVHHKDAKTLGKVCQIESALLRDLLLQKKNKDYILDAWYVSTASIVHLMKMQKTLGIVCQHKSTLSTLLRDYDLSKKKQ